MVSYPLLVTVAVHSILATPLLASFAAFVVTEASSCLKVIFLVFVSKQALEWVHLNHEYTQAVCPSDELIL